TGGFEPRCFFQAEDAIRAGHVTGVQTCALPISGLAADLLSPPEMAGTLPYMSPEQIRGKPCFASDQYALGIVVYEWLCGSRPFTDRKSVGEGRSVERGGGMYHGEKSNVLMCVVR